MWFFLVLNIFLLKTPSADFVNRFCVSPSVCSIWDLKFVCDLLPKDMLENLFLSRVRFDAKSFACEF